MRVLFTALVSFSLMACAVDDEDADVADDPADQVDTVERDVAVPSVPDATFTRAPQQRPSRPADAISRKQVTDPNASTPPLEQEPEDIGEAVKPGAPDSRRQTARIANPSNTF
jgi:hypothetical protein